MSRFTIHSRNASHQASDDGAEYDEPEAALALAIRGAMDVIAEEINGGAPSAAVEIGVEADDGRQVMHAVVSASVSPLMLRKERAAA